MPYASPTAVHDPSTGGIAPASWGDAVNAALDFLANPPSVRVRKAALQVIANGGSTLTWDTEDWDTDAIHDNAVNPTRLTCKTAGKYRLWVVAELAVNTGTWVRELAIMVNGSQIGGNGAPNVTTIQNKLAAYAEAALVVNDYVEFSHYHNQGGNLNTVPGNTKAGMTWFGLP